MKDAYRLSSDECRDMFRTLSEKSPQKVRRGLWLLFGLFADFLRIGQNPIHERTYQRAGEIKCRQKRCTLEYYCMELRNFLLSALRQNQLTDVALTGERFFLLCACQWLYILLNLADDLKKPGILSHEFYQEIHRNTSLSKLQLGMNKQFNFLSF